MPLSKKQYDRMTLFCREMRTNRFPNTTTFCAKLAKGYPDCACTPRTLLRDIQILRDEQHAPIEYDHFQRGYFLSRSWEFSAPYHDDQTIMASVIGARVAEQVLPNPLNSQIQLANAEILSTNNVDFLEDVTIDSFLLFGSYHAHIDPAVFNTVFTAWQKHHGLEIDYRNVDGQLTHRLIEPHVIALQANGAWYIKGICRLRNEERNFSIQRIISASISAKTFDPDRKLIEQAKKGAFYNFKVYDHVRLRCQVSLINDVKEIPLDLHQSIENQTDSTFDLCLEKMAKNDIIDFVLRKHGHVEIIEPVELRKILSDIAQQLLYHHAETK